MGLFNKKPDPIAERERMLNQQLAALEAEIKKLSQQQAQAAPAPAPAPVPVSSAQRTPPAQPRLRSTALPHGPNSSPGAAAAPVAVPTEPIFEEIPQNPFKGPAETPAPAQEKLGTRKSDLPALWQRLKTHFRGPSTSNPKLVNYLAAGSIQGLRPLRYEKRVARNRFIVLAVFLVLILWGIIAIILSKR